MSRRLLPASLSLAAVLLLTASACGESAWLPAPPPETPASASSLVDPPPDAAAAVPPDSAAVVLERTACYGRCPVYTVSAFADGRIAFEGRAHVARVGTAARRVDPGVVAGLVARAEAIDHAGYPDALTWGSPACTTMRTDGPTATTTVRTAGGTSRVEHYGNCGGFAGKAALTAFEDEVDRALGTAPYVGAQ